MSPALCRFSIFGTKNFKNIDVLPKILICMIGVDLREQLKQMFHEVHLKHRSEDEQRDFLENSLTFEDFLISEVLEKFFTNQVASYIAKHPSISPPQCTFWLDDENRRRQAAHAYAVEQTVAFVDALSLQKPGILSDPAEFSARLELVGSVNDLCRQILRNHAESKRIELELTQNARTSVTFDNVAAEASACD
jgi:hypothetical protein